MRRAWIEMINKIACKKNVEVALHAESVDRNSNSRFTSLLLRVALHAESVDRNTMVYT